jgi:hypothetical protein
MNPIKIDEILRDGYAPELPYGFAERVAAQAFAAGEQNSIWDLLLSFSPRATLALGAVTMILVMLGLAGPGPSFNESVDQYAAQSTLIELP